MDISIESVLPVERHRLEPLILQAGYGLQKSARYGMSSLAQGVGKA